MTRINIKKWKINKKQRKVIRNWERFLGDKNNTYKNFIELQKKRKKEEMQEKIKNTRTERKKKRKKKKPIKEKKKKKKKKN